MINISYRSKKSVYKILKNKKYVFVDFFDTLLFRRIHSSQIFLQWAKVLAVRYPELNNLGGGIDTLIRTRNEVESELRGFYEEGPYNEIIGKVYDRCRIGSVDREEFIEASKNIDVSIELGCQFGNSYIIDILKWSKKSGLKIYVVSDFYLPATCYNDFLLNAGCDGLIEDVFVSESINLTKRKGSLYPYVLEKTGALAEECVMIGDSRYSDVYMAEKNGIEGLWYFPLGHKIRTNISRKLKTDYSKNIFKSLSDYLYNNTCFEEYAFVIYSFAVKLFGYAKGDSVKKMAFLSRGGYFLKQAVDTYLSFFGIDDISTLYCYNSRKACFKAKDSDEDRRLLYEYLKDFMDVDRLVMVDEGWYCHSQQFIGKYLNLSTIGYYLGTRGTEKIDGGSRRGVVFNMDTDGRHSRLYGVFCTNCSMYEQMLTSSEGSVQGYEFTSSGIEPVLKENNTESELYHNVIERWQKRMLLTIKGLCAWNVGCDINDKKLAKMILRTSLFAGRERCEFLNLIDKSLVDNCKGGLQTHKNLKDVKISIGDFVVNPDMYLGQICKLQRKIYTNWFYNILYTIAAAGYYCYVRIVKWF